MEIGDLTSGQISNDVFEGMLESFRPPDTQFQIQVPTGPILHFWAPQRTSDIETFKREARQFAQRMLNTKLALPPEWDEVRPRTAEEAASAFTVHYYSAEPTKLSQLQACKLLTSPHLLAWLLDRITAHQTRIALEYEKKELEEAKNAFGVTDGTEQS